jgi:hypothetical protein
MTDALMKDWWYSRWYWKRMRTEHEYGSDMTFRERLATKRIRRFEVVQHCNGQGYVYYRIFYQYKGSETVYRTEDFSKDKDLCWVTSKRRYVSLCVDKDMLVTDLFYVKGMYPFATAYIAR